MKHIFPITNAYRLAVLAILLFVGVQQSRAQANLFVSSSFVGDDLSELSSPAHVDDVLIQFPGMSEKDISKVSSVLTSVSGVTVQAYCNTMQIFLLKVNRMACPSDEALMAALKTNQCGQFLFKADVTNDQVIAACSDVRY